jgi:peptidoglycan/LPS O-acetylase OafA/YrhL
MITKEQGSHLRLVPSLDAEADEAAPAPEGTVTPKGPDRPGGSDKHTGPGSETDRTGDSGPGSGTDGGGGLGDQGMPDRPRRRVSAFDGIRALAVLAVLGFHEGWPGLPGGFLGVDVFFVLSGYLITGTLITGQPLLRFWERRVRRLVPALVVMLVTVTAVVTLTQPDQLAALRGALLPALCYVSNWYEIAKHGSYFSLYGPPSPLMHLWSLAIEEQFYLVWPLVVLAIRPLRNRAIVPAALAIASAIAMAILYRHGGDPSRVYYGTDTHASALLVGAALAFVPKGPGKFTIPAPALDAVGAAGLAVLGWECGHFGGDDPVLYPYGLVVTALAAAAVIAAAAGDGAIAALLSAKPLRWLGERSYGIYLWHWPVIVLLTKNPVGSVFAVGLAAASWEFIERPILRDGFAATLRRWHRAAVSCHANYAVTALAGGLSIALLAVATYGLTRSPASGLTGQIAAGQRAVATSQIKSSPKRRAHVVMVNCGGTVVTAIGDSVMVASATALADRLRGVYIDAMVGRSMAEGLEVARTLEREHRLRRVVVAGLGTNGPVSAPQVRELERIAGPRRDVVLVTAFVPRPWQAEVNRVFAAAARHDKRVVLANWKRVIAGRTSLLWEDGIHPRPAGAPLYANVVARAVAKVCDQAQVRSADKDHRRSARARSRIRGK